MLIDIGRHPVQPVLAGPVELLLECHQRIRRFTGMAAALVAPGDASAQEIASTAAAVHRYFTVALPRHSADEEDSVAPRLKALPLPSLHDVLGAMTLQHGVIHGVLDQLVPRWSAIAADPASAASHAPAMDPLVAQLGHLWDCHLTMEETVVFPAIPRFLAPEARAEILAEMRARRGSPS